MKVYNDKKNRNRKKWLNWGQMTEEEQSDFLFRLSHQK